MGMTSPVHAAGTNQTRRDAIALIAIATVLPGFVALALLGSLTSHPRALPGFWDYPSGTIGDAILLPTFLATLLLQLRSQPRGNPRFERRLAVAGFAAGGVGGAIVPATWLADARTGRLWLMPRPQHFNVAGWVHAGYLTLTTGVLATLTVLAFSRIRASTANPATRESAILASAMTLAVGSGLGMLVLIGRDALVGRRTVASATTLISLAIVASAFVGGFAWAAREARWNAIRRPALIIAAFLAGLCMLIVGWRPHYPALSLIGWLSLTLAASAAAVGIPRDSPANRYRIPSAAAASCVLIGALVRSVDAGLHGDRRPFLWCAMGALIAAALTVSSRDRDAVRRAVRYALFFAYCLLLFYLASRIQSRPFAQHFAGASLAVADTAFDVMVFALIQARFGEMGERDKDMIAGEYVTESTYKLGRPAALPALHAGQPDVMGEVALLGFAVAFGLLTLLASAAPVLGLNHNARAPSPERLILVGALIVEGLVLVVSVSLLRRWRRTTREPEISPHLRHLQLPRWYWVAPTVAAAVWIVAILSLSGGPVHVALLGVSVGVVMFFTYSRTLLSSPTRLQTLEPTTGQMWLTMAVALSLGISGSWFVCTGAWQGHATLTGYWLAATALVLFLGNSVIFVTVGDALATGLPARDPDAPTQQLLAREVAKTYVVLDAAVYGLVFFICIAIPLYAATRDLALQRSTLSVIASMVFLPGLLTAVLWGVRNTRAIDELTQRAAKQDSLPFTLIQRTDGDWSAAQALDRQRVEALHHHWTLQRYSTLTLMTIGLMYLALVLLGY
jgi:hypothetical protein